MLTVDPFAHHAGPLNVLCLGAHSDDIEIGCGGTLLRLFAERPDTTARWVVFSAAGKRADEARASAADFLAGARSSEVQLEAFRDGFFPYDGGRVKEAFEAIKAQFQPDVVFTHCRGDLHQDHRIVNELTWNTFRDHLVLEYEIPKFDGDMGRPDTFVRLDTGTAARKTDLIWKHFASQREKHWLTRENLLALMRLRAIECRAPEGFAEAFFGRKIVW